MSAAQLAGLLFAEVERSGSRLGVGVRRTESSLDELFAWLIAIVSLGAVAWLAVRLVQRWRAKAAGSPWGLFRELCAAHKLERSDRALLARIARWQRLAHPARLFLEFERFDRTHLGSDLLPRLDEIHRLRDKLFAAAEEPERAESEPCEIAVSA